MKMGRVAESSSFDGGYEFGSEKGRGDKILLTVALRNDLIPSGHGSSKSRERGCVKEKMGKEKRDGDGYPERA